MCAQANGLLSRDGNPHALTGALVEFPSFSDALDDIRTSNDTRVTIDNNAAAISALAGLNEASGSWDQCLQVRPCCCASCMGQYCMVACVVSEFVLFREQRCSCTAVYLHGCLHSNAFYNQRMH